MTITNIRPGERIKVHSRGVTAADLLLVTIESANITDGAVTNAKIADDAITAAKIVANAIGASEISGGAVGTSELADIGVTTAKLADGAVTTLKLGADSVTAAKIADNAIGTEHLANGAVTAAEIADGAITALKYADDSITAGKIAANAIGASEIAGGAVGTSELADLGVTTAKIATGAVDTAQLADDSITAAKILANAIGASEIAGGAVGASELADGSVTALKYADVSITAGKYADNSIDTAKITAEAVTSAKLGTSLVLTGNPTVPLAPTSNESGSIASTLHVANKIDDVLGSGGVAILSPNLGGVPVTTTPTTNNDSAQVPNTSWVQDEIVTKANLTSPVFLGNPTVPLALTSNESGSIASTLHVANKIDDVLQSGGVVIDSPNFDGIPVTPTPPTNDDTAQVPNTTWVNDAIDGKVAHVGLVLNSPNFNGVPVTTTPGIDDDSAQVTHTSWVRDRIQVQVGDDLEALYDIVEQGDTPGNAPNAFSVDASLLGARSTKTPLPSSYIVTDDRGAVARFSGAFTVQKSDVFHVRSGRLYEITAVVQTRTNTPDTSGDAVHLKVRWLSRTKGATVGTDTDLDFDANPITGSGRVTLYGIVSTGSGSGIDAVIPAGAVFGRPYVQGFGSGAVRDVEFIQVRDVSITGTGDLSALQSQVASLISINTGPRLEDLESITDAPEIETYKALGDAEAAATAGTIKTTTDIVRVLYDTTPGDFGQDARRYLRTVAAPGTYDDSFLDDDGTNWTRLIDTPEEVCRYAASTNITADFTDRLKKAAANGRSLRLSPPVLGGSYVSGLVDLSTISSLYGVRLLMDDVTIKPSASKFIDTGSVGYAASYSVTSQSSGSATIGVSADPTLISVGDYVGLLAAVDPSGHPYWKSWRRVVSKTSSTVVVDRPFTFTFPATSLLLKKFAFKPDFFLRGNWTLDLADLVTAGVETDFQGLILNGAMRTYVERPAIENWDKPAAINSPISIQYSMDAFVTGARGRNNDFTDSVVNIANCALARVDKTDMLNCDTFGIAFSMCDRVESSFNNVCGKWDEGAGTNSVRGIKFFRCAEGVSQSDRVENFDSAWKVEDSGNIDIHNPVCFNSNTGINASHYQPTLGLTKRITVTNPNFQRIKTNGINATSDELQITGGFMRDMRSRCVSSLTRTLISGLQIDGGDTDANDVPFITAGAGSRINGLAVFDASPSAKAIFGLTSSDVVIGPLTRTSGLAFFRPSTTLPAMSEFPTQIGGQILSALRTGIVGQMGLPQSFQLTNGQFVDLTFTHDIAEVLICDSGNGNSAKAIMQHNVLDVQLVTTTNGEFMAGAPTASKIGLSKAVNSRVLRITSAIGSTRTLFVLCTGKLTTVGNIT